MSKNDQKIMDVKKQIELKKEKLEKSQKFTPVTNCSIEIDGNRHNLHTLKKEKIIPLMVKLNALATSAKELGLLEEYNISGYNVNDWLIDLKAKLDFESRKEEEAKLKKLEAELHEMLSSEKKVELRLEEIESILD